MAGRHKSDTKEFRELTFAEQARSITATINNPQAAIEHNVEHSPRRLETFDKCLAQVDRLKQRLQATLPERHSGNAPTGSIPDAQEAGRLRVMSPRLADRARAADFVKEVVEELHDAGLR